MPCLPCLRHVPRGRNVVKGAHAAGCQKRINPHVSQLLAHSGRPAHHGTQVPERVNDWPAAQARETSAKTPTVGLLTRRHGGYVRPAPTVGSLTGRHRGYVRPAPIVRLLTGRHGGYVRPAPTVGLLTGRHGGYVRPAPTVRLLTGRQGDQHHLFLLF